MDGTLSGAIMTGSGMLRGGNADTLTGSSSPSMYKVPAGFSPPLQAPNGLGNAPYTVFRGGNLADNGASRLNVAKAGISAIIDAYIQNTDFALETFETIATTLNYTWVYYMSPAKAGFAFTNNRANGKRYVNNPCFAYTYASATVMANCSSIAAANLYKPSALANSAYMEIGASSDDADINDVLYYNAGYSTRPPSVFVNYGGTNYPTPYPPYYSMADYNAGRILIRYAYAAPNGAPKATGPTNAGYVPYSPEVMYAQRGFGYGGDQSSTSGNVIVPMTTAGRSPTVLSITAAVGKFTPFLAPETSDLNSGEIKAVAGQAPTAGLLAKAKSYFSTVTTASNGCIPTQYVVLISDGLPTEDLAGRYWPPLGSAAAAGYGMTVTFNADGSLNTTNDQALTDTITNLAALRSTGIKTFVIGLGAGVDRTVNAAAADTLQAMAVAGGTSSFYPATSPGDMVAALNSILLKVQAGALSTTASSVNSSHLTASSVEYQSNFTSSDTPFQDWTGDLTERAIDPTTGKATGPIIWSAKTQLDSQASGAGWSSRLIATGNSVSSGATPFQWPSLSAAQQASLQPNDGLGKQRLDYLRGSATLEKRAGGPFRNRSHILGDIVDSQPAYVGVPSGPYPSASYRAYVQAKARRKPMLYAGANDGMLHAFDATTGAEKFAYIPYGVFSTLLRLTEPLYNQDHRFFVDGSVQTGDVQFNDASWHSIVVGGLGAGGKTVYALDATSPETLTSESTVAGAVLWEFGDPDMGLSFSEPHIAPVNNSAKFAVFFGNGYNSANNTDVLYAVNPQTGATLRKIDLCAAVSGACDASLPQGLSSVVSGNPDGVQGRAISVVYAGDLQGNLWAVDVSNADASAWRVRLLFKARDAAGAVQPITTAPLVSLHPNFPRFRGLFVMIGTGQLLTTGDLSSRQAQSAYGIWDKPPGVSSVTRSRLQDQTLAVVASSASGLPQDVLTATNNAIDWTVKLGWYADLPRPGQRIVTALQLLNGAFLTSINEPPSSSCDAGFKSFLMELNYKTGGSFDNPPLDVNGDGIIDARDTVKGVNKVVGISLGTGFASAATVVAGTGAKDSLNKKVTLSGMQQSVIKNNAPAKPQTFMWWQIK
ncbi:MAG: PilC/PilY family type IV pilus protein [Burkholderiaceae bacterium]